MEVLFRLKKNTNIFNTIYRQSTRITVDTVKSTLVLLEKERACVFAKASYS